MMKDIVVHHNDKIGYNDKTGVAAAFDGKGEFKTLFKLDPDGDQHRNFLKNGVLF
ncbi:hypothetical protein ACFBZI_09725 [Moraxella sp. ZJ142]|uniref:hypothetical protein n=1 Tax=Moraxella marmotae TaxID=3344520 RepID=UPI0035D52307